MYSFFILKIKDEPFPLMLMQQSHADPLLPARLTPAVDANNYNEDLLVHLLSSKCYSTGTLPYLSLPNITALPSVQQSDDEHIQG